MMMFTIVSLIALAIFAIVTFASGFFLTRFELPDISSCSSAPASPLTSTCWDSVRSYDRAFVVLIDALRFDFAQWSDSVDPQTAFNYQNKLARLHRRLRSMDQHTRLLRLHADAPTVTMQRLKAITTGSLPTFLDIRNNFDSERIDEDNLISQLASFGNLTLIGDDTWLNLYPTSFARAHAYPSFDVQDLHTVDNGCQMHLPTALNDTSSLLTVVHFLGVDHIGHRFHANHEFMAAKLRQMDEMIDGILEALHNRAQDRVLVMVFGDHGMTADGNHGGATRDETESALFIYSTVPLQTNIVADDFSSPQHVASSLFSASKSQQLFERDLNRYSSTKNADASDWFSNEISRAFSEVTSDTHDAHSIHIPRHSENDRSQFRLIDQIDIVPTLASLLGVPIPFANLGQLLPDLFLQSTLPTDAPPLAIEFDRWKNYAAALRQNAWQVHRYLQIYHSRSSAPDVAHASDVECFILGGDRFLNASALSDIELQTMHQSSWSADQSENWSKVRISLLKRAVSSYREFLKRTLESCRQRWVTFDLGRMTAGAVALPMVLWAFSARIAFHSHSDVSHVLAPHASFVLSIWKYSLVILLSIGVICYFASIALMWFESVCIAVSIASLFSIVQTVGMFINRPSSSPNADEGSLRRSSRLSNSQRSTPSLSPESKSASIASSLFSLGGLDLNCSRSAWILLSLFCGSNFSNSFVVAESDISLWLFGSLAIFRAFGLLLSVLRSSFSSESTLELVARAWKLILLAILTRLLSCIQLPADISILDSHGSFSIANLTVWAGISVLLLSAQIVVALLFRQSHGSSRWKHQFLIFFHAISWICIFSFWFSKSAFVASDGTHSTSTSELWLPRAAFCCTIFSFILGSIGSGFHGKDKQFDQSTTAAVSLFYFIGVIPLALVLGPRLWLHLALSALYVRVLISFRQPHKLSTSASGFSSSWFVSADEFLLKRIPAWLTKRFFPVSTTSTCSAPVPAHSNWADGSMLFLFCIRLFFCTGHANEFSSIAVNAGFIGIDRFSLLLSGSLVSLHTFCAEWLCAFALPLIEVASGKSFPNRWLTVQMLTIYACRAAFTTINVMLQRHHLMLWALFAPKYVFDVCKFFAISIAVILSKLLSSLFI